jgi:hypothetical protein
MIRAMQIAPFRGLNNVADPLTGGLENLERADNVDITKMGGIKKRAGYALSYSGDITSAFGTKDYSRLFLVDGGALKVLRDPTSAVTLRTGLSAAQMYSAEINGDVYFNNGAQRGIIHGDNTLSEWAWPVPAVPSVSAITGNLDAGLYRVRCAFVLPDGRITGGGDAAEVLLEAGQALSISNIPQIASYATEVYICAANKTEFQLAARTADTALNWFHGPDALGEELDSDTLSPLPEGATVFCFWKGCVYAAQYLAESEQTVIWKSQPLAFHLFNLAEDFLLVPGRVVMLAPVDDGIVIGTEIGNGDSILLTTGTSVTELAPYGVVAGWPAAMDEDSRTTMFWTARGLCSALPFANHTEGQISVAPGLRAGTEIVRADGTKRCVVTLQAGGIPFNAFT